jgi:uncharacterized Rossmann fold enzyme
MCDNPAMSTGYDNGIERSEYSTPTTPEGIKAAEERKRIEEAKQRVAYLIKNRMFHLLGDE